MARMAAPEERLTIEDGRVHVSGTYARPADPAATLVIAHGAGAGMDHPFIAGFSRSINDEGIATLRFNFPYIESGRRSPDPAPYLQEAWRAAFAEASARAKGEPVWAGGKSLGGRIAAMAVADGMPAAGLVFLGYPPTHPASLSGSRRTPHRIEVPMIFVEGTRDPFATPELAGVFPKLGDGADLISIEGGDHSMNVKGQRPRRCRAGRAGGGRHPGTDALMPRRTAGTPSTSRRPRRLRARRRTTVAQVPGSTYGTWAARRSTGVGMRSHHPGRRAASGRRPADDADGGATGTPNAGERATRPISRPNERGESTPALRPSVEAIAQTPTGSPACVQPSESKRLPCDLNDPDGAEHAHCRCPACHYILPCCGW